jgi:hypothetical protein
MNKEYSDSIIPIGIGASFVSALVMMLSASAIVGFLLREKINFPQLGGVFLLIIFSVLLIGPILYNRKKSRFEQGRSVLNRYDGIGIVQGLRGALFRLLVYEKGIEIRAFYHRYYIPFNKINRASIEEGYFNNRLNIVTGIDGVPDYIVSSGKEFLSLAFLIEKKAKSNT